MATKKLAAKEKERQFLLECIHLYRDLPVLWNVKSKVYHNRDQKNMAYRLLLAKYREMFPEATREDVKRKINAMRTNYRKELKKHLQSMKSASSTDSIYKPSLWYFREMAFLQNQDIASESFMDTSQSSSINVEDNEEQITDSKSFILDINQNSTRHDASPRSSAKRYSVKNASNYERFMNLKHESHDEITDEFFHWAMACATDLRKMDRTQQLYAKKAIAEILMEGQFGLLHRDSLKVNENPL